MRGAGRPRECILAPCSFANPTPTFAPAHSPSPPPPAQPPALPHPPAALPAYAAGSSCAPVRQGGSQRRRVSGLMTKRWGWQLVCCAMRRTPAFCSTPTGNLRAWRQHKNNQHNQFPPAGCPAASGTFPCLPESPPWRCAPPAAATARPAASQSRSAAHRWTAGEARWRGGVGESGRRGWPAGRTVQGVCWPLGNQKAPAEQSKEADTHSRSLYSTSLRQPGNAACTHRCQPLNVCPDAGRPRLKLRSLWGGLRFGLINTLSRNDAA